MYVPGHEVVCVEAKPKALGYPGIGTNSLTEGAHYIVEWAGSVSDVRWGLYSGVIVSGVPHSIPFDARRFRPVKREAIEIFRAMAASTKPLVEV